VSGVTVTTCSPLPRRMSLIRMFPPDLVPGPTIDAHSLGRIADSAPFVRRDSDPRGAPDVASAPRTHP
jgi:hypothetical protein